MQLFAILYKELKLCIVFPAEAVWDKNVAFWERSPYSFEMVYFDSVWIHTVQDSTGVISALLNTI